MRYAVESWAPEFGSPVDAPAMDKTGPPVEVDVEVAAASWRPRRPAVPPASTVRFLDGVRRIDARVWITTAAGEPRPALAATYAAGTVRCDGLASLEAFEVSRVLVSTLADADAVRTSCGDYQPVLADGDDGEFLVAAVQRQMRALERELAAASADAELTVVDGLLSRPSIPGAVGYVKTHHRAYLAPPLATVVTDLAPGERTPLFLTGGAQPRYSWYARLPGGDGHPLAGVVRGEADERLSVDEATTLADLATATWPRFASAAHKDPRAPQNLHPIAGLERALRHRLGDPAYLYRALRASAARPAR